MSARGPRWLAAITVRLGEPEYDQPDGGHRWMWLEGDCGLRLTKHTHAWEVFAWSILRSAALRCAGEPSAADMAATATLAGLCGPRTPGAGSAVRFIDAVDHLARRAS